MFVPLSLHVRVCVCVCVYYTNLEYASIPLKRTLNSLYKLW